MLHAISHRILLCTVLLCGMVLCGCEKADDWDVEREIRFVKCAALPSPRSAARAFVIDDKAYVVGGRSNSSQRSPEYCTDFWRYEPQADVWTRLPDPPFEGRVQAAVATVGGTAYYGMGYAGTGPYTLARYLNDFWKFDGEQWTRLADFPAQCSDALVTFATDTALFFCLGYNPLFQPEVYCYHISNDSWTQCRNVDYIDPAAGCIGGQACGRCFAGGGFMEVTYQQWSEYNPSTDSWQKRQSMPYPGRLFAPTATLADEIYVIGGMIWGSQTVGGGPTNTVYSYSPATDKWQLRGRLPYKMYNAVAFTIGSTLYCGLGQDENDNIHGDLYKTTP